MTLPRTILVPIDFSDCSVAALDYAVTLAVKLDARVTLLNVIGMPGLGVPDLGVALAPSVIDSLIRDNQAAINKLADARRSAGTIAEALIGTGDARDVIDRTATELGTDLIIMGTHGRRGIRRALLGSVAESTLRTAPCPVLTIRSNER
jgi:nucleotide-binding universal stress UspA family protein